MGTSVNQRSPDTLPWKAVAAGYTSADVPIRRILNQIWRANTPPDSSVVQNLGSTALFGIHQIARNESSGSVAQVTARSLIIHERASSIVSECAKRALAVTIANQSSVSSWRERLFVELTDYYVSRDAPGYVGRELRNKTVADLRAFKGEIRDHVSRVIRNVPGDPKNASEWVSYVDRVINALRAAE